MAHLQLQFAQTGAVPAVLTSGGELFRVDDLCGILLAGGLLDASADDGEGTPGARGK